MCDLRPFCFWVIDCIDSSHAFNVYVLLDKTAYCLLLFRNWLKSSTVGPSHPDLSVTIIIKVQISPGEELWMKNFPNAQLEHTKTSNLLICSSNWLLKLAPQIGSSNWILKLACLATPGKPEKREKIGWPSCKQNSTIYDAKTPQLAFQFQPHLQYCSVVSGIHNKQHRTG